jgi:hypothetical protein
VYGSRAEAEEAVRSLDQGGFPITQVSIVTQDLPGEKEGHGDITGGDGANGGIEWAAVAVSQRLLGGLGGWGVSRQYILRYEAYLQDVKLSGYCPWQP